jgi:hypothetical protein
MECIASSDPHVRDAGTRRREVGGLVHDASALAAGRDRQSEEQELPEHKLKRSAGPARQAMAMVVASPPEPVTP